MELDNSTIVLVLYCILAFLLAFYPAHLIFPRFIRKMKALGNTGKDVNKRGNIQVAEPQASEARCGRERPGGRLGPEDISGCLLGRRGLGQIGQVLGVRKRALLVAAQKT
jgi:hypothetical protein